MSVNKMYGGHALRIVFGITLLVLTAGVGQANPQPSLDLS